FLIPPVVNSVRSATSVQPPYRERCAEGMAPHLTTSSCYACLVAFTMTLHGDASRFRAALLTALVVFGLGGAALAQRRGFGGFPGRPMATEVQPNIEYDGRFTFVRVSYDTAPGGYWYRGLPSWAHGYPVAERNLMRIMNELPFLHAHDESVNVLTLDDPRVFEYPI